MEQQATDNAPEEQRARWIPIWVKLLLVVLALAGSVVYGFYKVGAGISDPEMIAKEYVKDLAAGLYENAYEQLMVEDETWFGETKFAQAMDASFTQCTIQEISAKAGRKQKQEDGSVTRHVAVSFTTDTGEQREWPVDMILDGKLLNFYDHWRIVPTEIMQENWMVAVPSGAALTIDNIPIGSEYLQETRAHEEENSAKQDVYVLPQVFRGTYRVLVEMENGTPWRGQLSTDSAQSVQMEPADTFYNDITETLEKAHETAFAAIFHSGSLEKLDKFADESSSFYQKVKERSQGADKTYDKWKDIEIDGITIDEFEMLDSSHTRVTYTIRETRIPKAGGESREQTEQETVLLESRGEKDIIIAE